MEYDFYDPEYVERMNELQQYDDDYYSSLEQSIWDDENDR
jgi:hypothetical protein